MIVTQSTSSVRWHAMLRVNKLVVVVSDHKVRHKPADRNYHYTRTTKVVKHKTPEKGKLKGGQMEVFKIWNVIKKDG